jgi:AcrR family transcriptional regulator
MSGSVKTVPEAHNGQVVERWTPERRRQQTRDVLVDAAAQVFAERGFEGASLEEIAERAGYSRGAIYKNFGGKDELFLAVNQRHNERAVARFAELIEELDSGGWNPASVPELAAEWRRMFFRDAELYILGTEFNLYVLRHPEVRPKLVEYMARNVAMIADFMEQMAAGAGVELPYPSELLARMLLSASDGFQQTMRLDPEGPDLVEPFLDLFIRAVSASDDVTPTAEQSS